MGFRNREVYIASKFGHSDITAFKSKESLVNKGYTIGSDWVSISISKAHQNKGNINDLVSCIIQAVREAGIIIVIPFPGGIGLHIETGMAIAISAVLTLLSGQSPDGIKDKKIFILGEENDRSPFYFHTLVTRVPDIEALLKLLPDIA